MKKFGLSAGVLTALILGVYFAFSSGQNEAVEIADAEPLSISSTDCADYAGSYGWTIFDADSRKNFSGSVQVSAGEATCTFTTSQIPNHDVGEDNKWVEVLASRRDVLDVTRNPELASAPNVRGFRANAIWLNGVKWEAYPAACFGEGREPAGR